MILNTYYPQNKYYGYTPQTKTCCRSQFAQISKDISFQGAMLPPVLKREISISVHSVSDAYESIMQLLSKKSDVGIQKIEQQYDNFNFGRSLTFHNCGSAKTSISVRVPDTKCGKEIMKIVVRKGKNPANNKKILHSYTIVESNKVVQDDNPSISFVFPKDIKFLALDSVNQNNLQKVLEDLDFAMLKFRKYLQTVKDVDLKAPVAKLDDVIVRKIQDVKELYSKIDETFRQLPHKSALKYKSEYPDYKMQARQPVFTLQNVGDEKYQMNIKQLSEDLSRFMVYDESGNVVDGFLIHDGNKLVSNFNLEYFNVIPPKLSYYDMNEIGGVIPNFEKYLGLYKEKLGNLNEYLTECIAKKNAPVKVGSDKRMIKVFNNIKDIYDNLQKSFQDISSSSCSKIKNSYQPWSAKGGTMGFSFKISDNENISIFRMKSTDNENILRFIWTKDDDNIVYLLNNGLVVKNFNTKYLTALPETLRYYSMEELSNLEVLPVLQLANKEMVKFEDYYKAALLKKNSKPQIAPKDVKTSKVITQENSNMENSPLENLETPTKTTRQTALKSKNDKSETCLHYSKKAYFELVKECKSRFNEALVNAADNIENFNNVMSEIQKSVNEFFKVKNS